MSFWDIAATAASIYAGATLGPWAGAAVGGGINALRGEDILGGAVSGYLGGMGGSDIAGAMDSTAAAAKAAGTNVGTINNAMLSNAGVLGPQATMTGFGGASASGLGSLPGATSNIATNAGNFGNFGNAQNINTNIGGRNLTNSINNPLRGATPFPTSAAPIPQNLQGVGGISATPKPTIPSYMDTSPKPYYNSPTDNLLPPLETPSNTTKFEPLGVGQKSPNFTPREVPIAEQYDFSQTARRPGEIPEGGFSWKDRFSAVSDNPGQFLDDLGGGGEYGKLIGGGKLALTGAGLVAPMFAEDYGVDEGYTSTFDDSRFRGPDGQLNLSGNTGLRLLAEGGPVSTGADSSGLPIGTTYKNMVASGTDPLTAATRLKLPNVPGGQYLNYVNPLATPYEQTGMASLSGSTDEERFAPLRSPTPVYGGGYDESEFIRSAGENSGVYATPSGGGTTRRIYEKMRNEGYAGGGTVQPQAGGGSRGGGGGVSNLLRNMMEGTAQNMQTTGVPEGMSIADVIRASRGYNSAGEKLAGGGYLSGGGALGDGMSDDIPAMIGNNQPAALSEGEFVIPADVVSHLGNGSSNAGSKQLYAMMDQVRKDRTGTKKQGNQIDPRRYMPV
jgi:hypothetical protein